LAGFRVGRLLDKIGMKASDTAELFFDDMHVPVANLIGGVEGQGFFQLMGQLPFKRTQIRRQRGGRRRARAGSRGSSDPTPFAIKG
jgi:alkylation response protein AidB-like acyl-CoA dehydrogenase